MLIVRPSSKISFRLLVKVIRSNLKVKVSNRRTKH